jgi:hypothetical protein
MGRQDRDQASLFYEFRLDDMIPKGHLLRRINVFVTSVLGDLHEQLGPFYSDTPAQCRAPRLPSSEDFPFPGRKEFRGELAGEHHSEKRSLRLLQRLVGGG